MPQPTKVVVSRVKIIKYKSKTYYFTNYQPKSYVL